MAHTIFGLASEEPSKFHAFHGLVLVCPRSTITYRLQDAYNDAHGCWCKCCGSSLTTERYDDIQKPFFRSEGALGYLWSRGTCLGALCHSARGWYVEPTRGRELLQPFASIYFASEHNALDALMTHVTGRVHMNGEQV